MVERAINERHRNGKHELQRRAMAFLSSELDRRKRDISFNAVGALKAQMRLLAHTYGGTDDIAREVEFRDRTATPDTAKRQADPDVEADYVVGYSVKWDRLSYDLGGFKEVFRRGAFADVLREKPDVLGFVNHDDNQLLGRTSAGTVSVREDSIGLRYAIKLDRTTIAKDLAKMVHRRDIKGASFAFVPKTDRFYLDGDEVVREVSRVSHLIDVSPVVSPAYPDSECHLQSRRDHDAQATRNAQHQLREMQLWSLER